MPYSILASVCQHPIRTSNSLPWSGSTLDFDVRYCTSCEASRSIRQERDNTYHEYERQRTSSRFNYDTYRDTRREYDNARLAYQEDLDYQQDRDDRERRTAGRPTLREEGRRFAGLDDPDWLRFKREMNRTDRTTRFAEPERSRRESQYRPQNSYRRRSSSYAPGRYSSARSYHNTSDPYEGDDEHEGGLRNLSGAQLDARMRRVDEELAR